jgi:uncharacterized protein (TIGR02246 family)
MKITYATPQQAEFAFYQAFEQGDAAAMRAVWEDSDEVVCVHPMGAALRGAQSVFEAWREILSGEVRMRFTIEEIHVTHVGPIAIHIVKEHIAVPGDKPVAPMMATNIYRESEDGWRMILHHASPSPGISLGQSAPAVH